MNEFSGIAIAPGNKFDEEIIRKLANILERDLYYARSVLNSKIPRIVSRQTDPQKINEILKQFESLGLAVFGFDEIEIKKPLQLFKATSAEFGNNDWAFKDKNLKLFKLEKSKAFLILKGILTTSSEKETVTSTKKLNIAATLLTGGIPIRRNVQQKKIETAIESEGFIRIFERDSNDFCLEIKQRSFNYACLGKEMASSSKQNLSLTARRLKEFYAEAFFKDYPDAFNANNNPRNPLDAGIDGNCRLIYMFRSRPKSR